MKKIIVCVVRMRKGSICNVLYWFENKGQTAMTAVRRITEHIPVAGAVHHGIELRHYGSEFMKTTVWGANYLIYLKVDKIHLEYIISLL